MSNNSLTDNVLAVGIDDGHDGIKVAYFEPEKKEIVCFRMPSVAQEGIGDMASAPEHELNNMLITIHKGNNAVHYLVDGERKVIKEPMDTRFAEYPISDLNIALIAQALRKAGVPYSKLFITAGLPANQYFDKESGKTNKTLIEAKHNNINRLPQVRSAAAPNMFYSVVGVETLPEGYGVAVDITADNNFAQTDFGIEARETGFIVIDIGGRTVDLVKIMANLQPRPNDSYSFNSGMLYLRDEMRSRVADKIGLSSISDKMVDAIIQTGWHGKPNKMGSTDLTEMRNYVLQSFAERIHREIIGVLNTSDEAMGGLVITGGGSYALGNYLLQALLNKGFRYEIILQEQPEFGNAKGFCKCSIYHLVHRYM